MTFCSFSTRFVSALWCLWVFVFSAVPARADETLRTLYVYARPGFCAPEVVKEFEKRYNCVVEVEYYENEDVMQEKVGSPGSGFDVVMMISGLAESLRKRGLLADLDHDRIPNLDLVQSRMLAKFPDQERRYSVPYEILASCVAYNRRKVASDDIGSWELFSRPGYANEAALMADMRFALGAALKSLGHSVNTQNPDEIARAGETLKEWKKNVGLFSTDLSREELVSGELAFIQTVHGYFLPLAQRNANLDFFMPKEGSIVVCGCLVIPADAGEPELANEFINFIVEPKNAAKTMKKSWFYIPIPEARKLLLPDPDANPLFKIPMETIAKCEPILDVGDAIHYYDEVWLEVLLSGKLRAETPR